jgi:hypothetical protein
MGVTDRITMEIIAGETGPTFHIELDDPSDTLDLTGYTITGKIKDRYGGVIAASNGVFSVTDGPNRLFDYTPGSTESTSAGTFNFRFKFTPAVGNAFSKPTREAEAILIVRQKWTVPS